MNDKLKYSIHFCVFLIFISNVNSGELAYMSKNELKVCSGNYNDGNKEFTGTYMNGYMNGKYQEYRVGVWKFWYHNGKIKFEGMYKDGVLISKKCWNSDGENISCNSLEISESEKYRMFKNQ